MDKDEIRRELTKRIRRRPDGTRTIDAADLADLDFRLTPGVIVLDVGEDGAPVTVEVIADKEQA